MTKPATLQHDGIRLLRDGEYYAVLRRLIDGARHRIWVSAFTFNPQPVFDGYLLVRLVARLLAKAQRRGVDVRVLIGGSGDAPLAQPAGNASGLLLLRTLGVESRMYGAARRSSHAKYAIVDDESLVGSHNWSPRAFRDGVDTSVAIRSDQLSSRLARQFLADWTASQSSRRFPETRDLLRYVSRTAVDAPGVPDSGERKLGPDVKKVFTGGTVSLLTDADYLSELLAAIKSAIRSIHVSMFYFSYSRNPKHPARLILGALESAHKRGVQIKILLDRDRPTDIYASSRINREAAAALKKAGIKVGLDAVDRVNHSKFVAVDDRLVLIGSHNWTGNSVASLRELSLSIVNADLAKRCANLVDAAIG